MAYADAVQAVLRIEREPLRIIMDDLAPKTLPSKANTPSTVPRSATTR